jgi:glutaminyl-tRNA synthetase
MDFIRAHQSLNKTATRVNAVINPVKLVITNYPEDKVELMETINNPEDETAGSREIAFTRELYVEQDDFMEEAPKKYFRLTPGQEVRLKSAYIVKCTGCKKDDSGNVIEIYAEYDPQTKSGIPDANRKVKGTLHWVSATHCLDAEVRIYDRLFSIENPSADERDFRDLLNPDSLKVLTNCKVELSLKEANTLAQFQFQRIGYFNVDLDSTPDKLIFNRTVSLKDSWAKEMNKQ